MHNTVRGIILAGVLFGSAHAQTAAELVTVTSITSTLASGGSIRLPAGTSLVSNPRYANELAPRLLASDAARFGEYRLYVARGLAQRLVPAFVANVKTGFAAGGLFEEGGRTQTLGGETWTRSTFSNDAGQTAVLFVAQRVDGVYMFTAQQR